MDISQVQRRIEMMERYRQEIRVAKDALKQELEASADYMEAFAQSKEAMTKKKRLKDEILSKEGCKKLVDDIKVNNDEIEALNETLAQELMEHYQASGRNEILDGNGKTRKFILSVKVLPKRGKFNEQE